jgi:hypothetical protein
MITPVEIKQACLKKWKEVLLHALNGTGEGELISQPLIFPMEITRIGKIKAKDILTNLLKYREEIHLLQQQSKEIKGYGYTIQWEERIFEKIGMNKVPEKIFIGSLDDYLKVTGKEKEYNCFIRHSKLILSCLPQLKEWIQFNPLKVIEHPYWPETLSVCQYFIQNPQPKLYIRQLPVKVHTKFIKEENELLFRSLLDYLLAGNINSSESRFEKRYNLKFAEPLVRVRFLDNVLSPVSRISDISISLSEFKNFYCNATRVLVAENLMNFLTLPDIPRGIALWSGGGFNVSYLKDVEWLQPLQLIYWGDIDAHGFHILNQFRTYFPDTKAIMMDQETLHAFYTPEDKKGPKVSALNLPGLLPEENKLYNYLCETRIRLEQEKIAQIYAERKILDSITEDE